MELKPGYKQTELGSLPEDWEEVELGEFLDFKNGLNKAKEYFGFGTPIINYMDVYNNAGLMANDILGRVTVTKQELEAYGANRGDIFFTRTSETAEEVGMASVLLEDIPNTVFSGFVLRGRPINSKLSDSFKKYCFSSEIVRNQIVSKSTYTTRALTNGRSLSSVLIPLPTQTDEQDAIADTLGDIDDLIESLEQLIAKKRQIKQGAEQELLTGEKRLPGFYGGWSKTALKKFLIAPPNYGINAPGVPRSHNLPTYLRITDIDANGRFVKEGRVAVDHPLASEYMLSDGDIVIARTGASVGKSYLFNRSDGDQIVFAGFLIRLRVDRTKLHPNFFESFTHTSRYWSWILATSTRSGQPGINSNELKDLPVLHPPTIEEQVSIANTLDDLKSELHSLETRLAKSRRIKQGMMQELLTGKIRLVQRAANVVQFPSQVERVATAGKGHNKPFDDAVFISVLVKEFGSEQRPLGRKRYTKFSYLLHRRLGDGRDKEYLPKAAGPYDPSTKYKGGEAIAIKNKYIRKHSSGSFPGFVAAEKIADAEQYFSEWGRSEALTWLKQFHYETTERLELLTTVDMAMVNLCEAGKHVELASVKQYIHDAPEWTAKLDRAIFSDDNIDMAIKWSRQLFEF